MKNRPKSNPFPKVAVEDEEVNEFSFPNRKSVFCHLIITACPCWHLVGSGLFCFLLFLVCLFVFFVVVVCFFIMPFHRERIFFKLILKAA